MTQKTLLLTGASRGIGHATVKVFQAAGWRVLTVSRTAFDARCPWHAGSTDHFQGDLSDASARQDLVERVRETLGESGQGGDVVLVDSRRDVVLEFLEEARGYALKCHDPSGRCLETLLLLIVESKWHGTSLRVLGST